MLTKMIGMIFSKPKVSQKSIIMLIRQDIVFTLTMSKPIDESKNNMITFDSVLFEDLRCILWVCQTLTFGWLITMVTVTCGTCSHGYHGNAIDVFLLMCKSCHLDP